MTFLQLRGGLIAGALYFAACALVTDAQPAPRKESTMDTPASPWRPHTEQPTTQVKAIILIQPHGGDPVPLSELHVWVPSEGYWISASSHLKIRHTEFHWREVQPLLETQPPSRKLAELVLNMQMATDKGLVARQLARDVLGIPDHGRAPAMTPITTNGTTRLIPDDEPVFLLRGQDQHASKTVCFWASEVEAAGGDPEIVRVARAQAVKMHDWPKKKEPDLPVSWMRDEEATAQLLAGVGIKVLAEDVAYWQDHQVRHAEEWAAAVHLNIASNAVSVPPMPVFLYPFATRAMS